MEPELIKVVGRAFVRRIYKCFLLAICSISNAAEPVRIAVLTGGNGDAPPLAALLEAHLSANERYAVLERESISELIKEWDLNLLSAAESVAKRAELGGLLKADILVLLSEHAQPSPRLELVVSETTRGLRLRTGSFPKSKDVDENLRVLQAEIGAAIAKQAEVLTGIYAVPPFISMDLTGDHSHLGFAYARLLEACLQEIPGILVVEIAEARKIAEELILTGSAIERDQPIYLLGEYRFDTVNRDKPPFLRLVAKQGKKEIWREDADNATPSTAAAFLRDSARERLRTAEKAQPLGSDRLSEIQTLNKRARETFAVGFYEECAQVAEASLSLDPQQQEARQLAMTAYGWSCIKSKKPLLEKLRYHMLALPHAEALLIQGDLDFTKSERFVSVKNSIHIAIPPFIPSLDRASEEERKAVKNYFRHRRDMLIHVITAKHEAAQLNDAILNVTLSGCLTDHSHYRESLRDNLQGRLLLAPMLLSRGVTHHESHLRDLTLYGLTDTMKSSGDYAWFLDELSSIKHSAVTRVVASERKIAADLKAGRKAEPEETQTRKSSDGAATVGTVRFEPIRFQIPGNDPLWLQGMHDCANGTDILWGWSPAGSVFLMKEKGVLQPLHKTAADTQVGQIAFDGKYLWMPVEGKKSEILAINPVTGAVVVFTAEDGFPNFQFSACAPIGEGRLCFSGSFGVQSDRRAYIAVLELAAGGEKKVKIIHEATRQRLPDEPERKAEMDANLSFSPSFMLSKRGENGNPWEVILKRRYENSCLSIHPDEGKVEAFLVEQHSLPRQVTLLQNQAVWPASGHLKSLRAGGREIVNLRKVPAYRHGTDARVLLHENRTHLLDDEWWIAEGEDEPFRKLAGKIPGNRNHHRNLYLSSHYGIVFTTSTEKDKAYQVLLTTTPTDSP